MQPTLPLVETDPSSRIRRGAAGPDGDRPAAAVSVRQPAAAHASDSLARCPGSSQIVAEVLDRMAQSACIDSALDAIGAIIGRTFDLDCVQFHRFVQISETDGSPSAVLAVNWTASGRPDSSNGPLPGRPALHLHRSELERLKRGETICAQDSLIEQRSDTGGATATGWRAHLAIPIFDASSCWGFMSAGNAGQPREWDATRLDAMRLIAGAVGAMVAREQRFEARLVVERTRAETAEDAYRALSTRKTLLESVVAASEQLLQAAGIDEAAAGVLERIGRALQADRVVIGRMLPADERSRVGWITFEHEWTVEGIPRQTDDPALKTLDLEHYKEFDASLRRGEPVMSLTEEFSAQGRTEQEATGARSQFQYPILIDGLLWGTFGVDDCHEPRIWKEAETATLRLVATALGSLLKRERLAQARIDAERELAEERARMAREIHDTLAQGFTGVIMQLHAAEDALECGDPVDAGRHVELALDRGRMGLAEARRSVYALRPPMMENGDLASALRTFVSRVLGDGPIRGQVHSKGDTTRLDPGVAFELFRIAQEALGNAMRHARAQRIDVRLNVGDSGDAMLEIADDGCGFDAALAATTEGGFGLVSMRERAARLQARFELDSGPGRGTRVRVTSPAADRPSGVPDSKAAPSTQPLGGSHHG